MSKQQGTVVIPKVDGHHDIRFTSEAVTAAVIKSERPLTASSLNLISLGSSSSNLILVTAFPC